jgi:hypothetical protein
VVLSRVKSLASHLLRSYPLKVTMANIKWFKKLVEAILGKS